MPNTTSSNLGAPTVSTSLQEHDKMFFKHLRKIYKYMAAIERGNKAAAKNAQKDADSIERQYFSDCIEPLNRYVRETYITDNESSHGSLTNTMTSGFSDNYL